MPHVVATAVKKCYVTSGGVGEEGVGNGSSYSPNCAWRSYFFFRSVFQDLPVSPTVCPPVFFVLPAGNGAPFSRQWSHEALPTSMSAPLFTGEVCLSTFFPTAVSSTYQRGRFVCPRSPAPIQNEVPRKYSKTHYCERRAYSQRSIRWRRIDLVAIKARPSRFPSLGQHSGRTLHDPSAATAPGPASLAKCRRPMPHFAS